MTADDARRWDARYEGRDVEEPAPPDVLVRAGALDLIPTTGRALDVACGTGAQSAWLADHGLDVVAIDASPEAIRLTDAAARSAAVAERVDARVVDLDHGIPVELGTFDVIVCQRFRGTDLYPSFIERLASGGMSIVTVLSRTGAVEPGPFHAPSRELLEAFGRDDVEIVFHDEADGQESIIARRR
jgi:SAM-dependent methyltransferase